MRNTYTREKRTLCGGELHGGRPVCHYPGGTPGQAQEKCRPSSERQKRRNAQHAHRRRVQKANANFTVLGFYLTLTYAEEYLPESMEQAEKDLRNYIRRLKTAILAAFGPGFALRYMGLTGCGRKSERYHHHLLIECPGLTMRQNADFRQLLEDKWSARQPDGSYESFGYS